MVAHSVTETSTILVTDIVGSTHERAGEVGIRRHLEREHAQRVATRS